MNKICRICDNSTGNQFHSFREMMFGTRDEFQYIECSLCGTIQIGSFPDNIHEYYPKSYGSFENFESQTLSQKISSRLIAKAAGRYFTDSGSLFGRIVTSLRTWPEELFPVYLREPALQLTVRSKILDFGCGTGDLLLKLRYFGFRSLVGIDAFIEKDIEYANGVKVVKGVLESGAPVFDLIILNHSFEHLPDPVEFLKIARTRLQRGKYCIIRMPVVARAWQLYGKNWAQLDAPRHFHLFTETGFRELAPRSGFVVDKVIYDSFAYYQFWTSELYKRDIPLRSIDENEERLRQSLFSKGDIQEWEIEAKRLNEASEGDQACFFLRAV